MRKEFVGGALPAKLTAGITTADTTLTIDTALGWPTGVFPFVITVGRGVNEEKMLCSAQATGTITVTTRGYDGTTAKAHVVDETVEHTLDADTINEANAFVNAGGTITVPAPTDDVLGFRVNGDTSSRFLINADGKLEWGPGNAVTDANISRTGVNRLQLGQLVDVVTALAIGNITSAGARRLSVRPYNATDVAVVVQGAVSQSASLQEWQDSAGTVRTRVAAQGGFYPPNIYIASGTAVAPAYTFDGDPDTGIYSYAANQVGITAGGIFTIAISNARLHSNVPVELPDGTAAAPAYRFASDPDTGIYNRGVPNVLLFSTGGVERFQIDAVGRLSGVDGSPAAPTFTFMNDPDTGIYQVAADHVSIARAGVAWVHANVNGWIPAADNARTLGQPDFRWSTVYAVTGTINTSDELTKNIIKQTPLGLDFINALAPKRYKFNGGKRMHDGLLAQQVLEAAQSCGVEDLAAYIDPAKGAIKPKRADYETNEEYQRAQEQYQAELNAPKGLRYSELIAPLIRAVQELSAKVEELEAR